MERSLQAEEPEEKLWYTVKELAAEWGLSEGWIRDHARTKQPRITGRKFGKLVRFHVDDIRDFLDRIATGRDFERKSPHKIYSEKTRSRAGPGV